MATPPMSRSRSNEQANIPLMDNLKQQKWLTLIGLPVLLMSTLLGIYTLWGVLFVYWGATSVLSGQVYLLEPIERRSDPALFWIIVAMWIVSGGLYVIGDFFPAIWY